MRSLEARGHAEQISPGRSSDEGLGSHLIRIHPRRLVSWNVNPDHPDMHMFDVLADTDLNPPEATRPVLDLGGRAAHGPEPGGAALRMAFSERCGSWTWRA